MKIRKNWRRAAKASEMDVDTWIKWRLDKAARETLLDTAISSGFTKRSKALTVRELIEKEKQKWYDWADHKPMTTVQLLDMPSPEGFTVPPWFVPDKESPFCEPRGVCVFDEFPIVTVANYKEWLEHGLPVPDELDGQCG